MSLNSTIRMSPTFIGRLLIELRLARKRKKRALAEADSKARRIAQDVIASESGDKLLGVVQGPPGTGKTSIYVDVISSALHKGLIGIPQGKLPVYIAPSNNLVVETAARTVANILAGEELYGKEALEVIAGVRLLGSKVVVAKREDIELLARELGVSIEDLEKIINKIVYRVVDDNIFAIFATEYQDVTAFLGHLRVSSLHTSLVLNLLVDEASRDLVYSPFRTVLSCLESPGAFWRRLRLDFGGMCVIGDPEQAIMLSDELRGVTRSKLLLIELARKFLMKEGLCELRNGKMHGKMCVSLDVTKRIPHPSHEPISYGFYNSWLRSVTEFDPNTRYERVRKLSSVVDTLSNLVNVLKPIWPSKAVRVLDVISDKLVATHLAAIEVPRVWPIEGYRRGNFEPNRVRIAATLALGLGIAACKESEPIDILVTAPYRELVSGVQATLYDLASKLGDLGYKALTLVRVATTQSMLGGEADIVISILGKERPISRDYSLIGLDQEIQTMYYMEPEVLNVQLSRHRVLMVVIGSLTAFRDVYREARHNLNEFFRKYPLTRRETIKMLKAMDKLLQVVTEHGVLAKIGV